MTKQTDFIVAKGEEQLGPMSIAQVAAEIASGNIAVTDYVYDLDKSDWITLFECEALKMHLAQSKPKAPPKVTPKAEQKAEPKVEQTASQNEAVEETSSVVPMSTTPNEGKAEWYVQKGQHRYGPFSYLSVLKGLQDKTIYEFDLISKDIDSDGSAQWYRIAELAEFSADNVRSLQETAEAVFTTRKFPRVEFDVEVIVHDNSNVWMGRAFEASAGGTGLIIENATLVPGQTLLLHFAGKDELPAFNALCEIVGKKFSKEVRAENSPVQYAVRFVKLDSKVEKAVQNYFLSKPARAVA
ncbi:MAG: PilZ domain-containing protein [Bdellovibrionota bacterium]